MGCVQAKAYPHTPPRNLERLKLENGYVKGGVELGRPVKDLDDGRGIRGEGDAKNARNGNGVERKISKESERGSGNSGNVSQRMLEKKEKSGTGDELVDGWPKWLVQNISKDALAGFVPKTADSYDKLAKVGHGTYSNVYKARDKDTGKIVALKKVRFDTSEPESVRFMAREIIMLKKLDHPNVIKLEGIATSRMQYSLYLVFDFMPSDLTKVINRSQGRLTIPQVKCYMQQLLSGLQHCHERGILHRDIKGSNLLIDKTGMLKIADFGLANFYNTKPRRLMTSRVVTLWYRAPELLLGSTDYGVGIDLWSAGCLLAEMFVGKPIMTGRNEIEQLHKIFKLCGSPSEDYWKRMKPPTTFRPQQYKPSLHETFAYFPDSTLTLLTRLLALDPAYRGNAALALQSEFFSTSPSACDLSDLPVISTQYDEPVQQIDRKINGTLRSKQQSRRNLGDHRRKVSFPEQPKDEYACYKEEKTMEMSFQSQETANSTSSTSSSTRQSKSQEIPPHSPSPAFRSQYNRAAKTEAHPNALKNIKNYPLLLASLTEAANHLEASNSSLYRRSLSNIDFRTLDLEKISKLFGLEDN